MNQRPAVAAVIPNRNRADLLRRVLADLESQTLRPVEIIVVDNGSTDQSAAVAEASGARVIRLTGNQGFAKAVNRGITASGAEWVLILNNDVSFGPEWLETLAGAAAGSGLWFAVGKMLTERDPAKLDGTYDAVCRGGTAWHCGHSRLDGPLWSTSRRIQFPPLAAALVRRDLFDEVGYLDEQFEMYLEDVDFGLRCAAAGRIGLYVPVAVAVHAGSATLGAWHKATVRYISRNQILLLRKHFRGAPLWPKVVAQLLWGITALRHRAGLSWLRGKVDGFFASVDPAPQSWSTIAKIVRESERDIYRLQCESGFDRHWRIYFALVRG